MAEAVLKHLLSVKCDSGIEWNIDSAAIADWQVGNPPDRNTLKVLQKNNINGYDENSHIAQQIHEEHFIKFDFILGMDQYNLQDLHYLNPSNSKATIKLLGEYDPDYQDPEIPDPFMAHEREFDKVFEKVYRSCVNFLDSQLKTTEL